MFITLHVMLTPEPQLTGLSPQYHNEGVLKKYTPKLKIGEVKDAAKL